MNQTSQNVGGNKPRFLEDSYPGTRAEHLAWAKQRALECAERGDVQGAFQSMASDLLKHKDTREHPGILLGTAMLLTGQLTTVAEMRGFIEGFH